MDRRPYLVEVSGALWPGDLPARVHRGRPPAGAGLTLLAVPTGHSPSLLLPPGRAAAAGAVRAYGGHVSRRARLRTGAVAAVLSLGLGPLLFRDRVSVGRAGEGISGELARILGVPVQVGVRGGPARANRKPVLAVLDGRGTLLAFAKLGTTPLTQQLVRDEGEALRRLAGGTDVVRVPRLLHCAPWRETVLLVQEALPVRDARPVPDKLLLKAMTEISAALGRTTAPWMASEHAESLRRRLAAVPESDGKAALDRAVSMLAGEPQPLSLGAWHGDWTPWNCAVSDGTVLVWDWERFATGVPVGFDVLHHDLQAVLATGTPTPDQPRALLSEAPGRLAPLGLTPRQAGVTALAYLLEIAVRYLADDQRSAGARVGGLESWLLPVIADATAQLTADRGVTNV